MTRYITPRSPFADEVISGCFPNGNQKLPLERDMGYNQAYDPLAGVTLWHTCNHWGFFKNGFRWSGYDAKLQEISIPDFVTKLKEALDAKIP